MKIKNLSNIFYLLIFTFAIFFPLFQNKIGSAGILIINLPIIIFLSLFIYFNYCKFGRINFIDSNHSKIAKKYLFPIVALFFLIPISMIVGVISGGINIIERDFYELYRPLLYILIFIFSYMYFSQVERVEYLEKVLLFVFIIVVLFGLNHVFRVFDSLSELYTKQSNIRSGRVSIPFVNPYDYAFFMTFFIYYFLVKTIYDKIYYLPLFIAAVIMFLLPQSRSVAVGLMLGFIGIMPLLMARININYKKIKINKRFAYFIISFIAILVLFFLSTAYLIDNFGYLTGQFIRLKEDGEVGRSASTRLNQFIFAVDKAVTSPLILIFGNGPAKDEMEYVESIYTYLFYRYGLTGLIIYFYFILISIAFIYDVVKKTKSSKCHSLYVTLLLWFLTIPFLSIGNNFTEQVRISFFYYMVLGLTASSYYRVYTKTS